MRFGVSMNTDHTLEEVSLQFLVTRERIRQIEIVFSFFKKSNCSSFFNLLNMSFEILHLYRFI